MTITEIAAQIESGQKTAEEKLILLRQTRAKMMEELHRKQQLIDQVDYMIYEIKKSGQI